MEQLEMKHKPLTVEEYIESFPENIQTLLIRVRAIIQENAPEAMEEIAYGMPAYKYNGKPLVYFAAFSKHIGFYATPTGHKKFEKELSSYKQGKGSVQFPLDQPLPYKLIGEMVQFRVREYNSK
jgi:uncharacterized protein YdhG (YjbR/CyaY superfamily)